MRAAIIGAALALLFTSHGALAQKRVALVIGNSAYTAVPALPNPVNDAVAIADLLKSAGFDSVNVRLDASGAELRRAVSEFSEAAADADISLVYYAGHGIEIDGTNYLVPVDAKLSRDFDVDDEALSLDRVLRSIESSRRLRLVILDACRDNPFVKAMKRTTASRSIGRGLARVEPAIANTLVAFAAKAGSVALDGTGQNSPFTSAVLKNIATPGIDIRLAFGRVRDDVLRLTGQKQEPFVYGSLGGDTISLVYGSGESPTPNAAVPVVSSEAAQAWASIKDTQNTAILETFITRYGGSFYADLARARLQELQRALKPTVVPRATKRDERRQATRSKEKASRNCISRAWVCARVIGGCTASNRAAWIRGWHSVNPRTRFCA